jgi:hypothetical protein
MCMVSSSDVGEDTSKPEIIHLAEKRAIRRSEMLALAAGL